MDLEQAMRLIADRGMVVDDGSGWMEPLTYLADAERLVPGVGACLTTVQFHGEGATVFPAVGLPLFCEMPPR